MTEITRRDVLLGTAAVAASAALPQAVVNELVHCVERATIPVYQPLTMRWRAAQLLDGVWVIIDEGTGPIGPDDLVQVIGGPV